MSGSPRSNNGSSVTSPSRPTASPAADNSHLQQQQQQQQQYQQQPMYGMPLSNQSVHATTAAASSTAAAAIAAPAATTATAAVTGCSSQPGQQSNFVPIGPYQYQVEEDFSLHLNEVLLVPRLGFNLMSSAQLMKNGITLPGEPGKFTLKYGDKKLGTIVEQNGVFVLNFIPERTTADSDNILSLGPWEHRDDIYYTDDTVPCEGVVPTSSTMAAAVMLTFDDQGLNDVQSSREYMAAVEGWGDPTNMPTDDGIWGADEPDETTWGETPAARGDRLLAEAEQRVADMEILHLGRLVGIEPVPAASDQESGELVLAPDEYVDVEVRVPPPNLTRYVAPAFDQIRSDGHQLLLSFFANAEYYLPAQGHKATGETWHTRLGHPSQFTLNNTIKAVVLDKNSLLLPSGLELKPVNRPAPCTVCPAANLPHEPFPTHFPGAEDYHLMDKVLQRFDFTYSLPQATPLSTRHSLSALPSDESVEPSGPYPELVGCLMYLMTCTRPDLAYPLSILARYVAPGRHRPEHMATAKRVLRYLCSTSGMGLVLGGRRPVVLTGHADASWADDQATQRSSQGYTFSLGSGSVLWRSTRSSSFLSSSCEAEIYAGAMAAQELRWLTYLLTDLGEQPRSPPVLYVDNKAMLALCREHRLEHRTKHIALRYFLARELQQRGQLRLAYVASEANTADIFTKALPPGDHQHLCTMLACFALLVWSCDLLFSPTLPMGYRPPTAPLGKFDQRAKWGLHLSIEKQYLAWRIMDYRSRLLVPARDCIFYENLTLPIFERHLTTQQNPATLFHGVRSFASADAELVASEEPDPDGAREAVPDPPVPVTSSGMPEFIPLANAAPEDVRDVHHTYLMDELRQPMPVVSDSSICVIPDEIGGAMNLEPKTARQALSGPHREKWREAMDRELAALEKRETWDLIPIEKMVNRNVLTGKWVFRVKTKADGTYEKHKARWVVRGFDQTHGIDYTLTFTPVSRHTSVRLVFCEAAEKNFPLRQIDVSNAFLYADVDAEIYVEYPHTYPTNSPSVCKLKKSLYGIKQAPRLWQQHLNKKLTEVGFRQLPHDSGMYRLDDKGSYALLVAYVDNILYVSSSTSLGDRIEVGLKKSLDLTISTKVTQFLGLNISRTSSAIHLTASKYAESLGKHFNISTDFVATPYRSTLTGHVPNLKKLSAAGLQLYQQQLGCLLFAAVT
ncbi:unnamed protein product [Closterium sp. NIES-53]